MRDLVCATWYFRALDFDFYFVKNICYKMSLEANFITNPLIISELTTYNNMETYFSTDVYKFIVIFALLGFQG